MEETTKYFLNFNDIGFNGIYAYEKLVLLALK